MGVRLVESRIPSGYAVADLGESSSSNGFHLVSYLTSPLRTSESNTYVVFCEGKAFLPINYEWRVLENSILVYAATSEEGYLDYKTAATKGTLLVQVNIYENSEYVMSLTLTQIVGAQNPQLEARINNLILPSGPLIALGGDPITSREIVNDFKKYIDLASLQSGNLGVPPIVLAALAYKESVFRPKEWKYTTPLSIGPFIRNYQIGTIASDENLIQTSDSSLGVCQIKRSTAAMVLGLIPWHELPGDEAGRETTKSLIENQFTSLSLENKIDLFNLLRFPKANITIACKLLTELKNRTKSNTARWPSITKTDLVESEFAIKIIATEYNIGATSTPKEQAGANKYGASVYTLSLSPYLRPFFFDTTFSVAKPTMRFTPAHVNGWRNESRISANIDSVVIHTIEGTAAAGVATFQNQNSNVSAHFIVAANGDIVQMVEIEDVAFTSNYYNDRSISIECEGFAAQANSWTDQLMRSLAKLVAWCCNEYEILPYHPLTVATSNSDKLDEPGIVGHYQIHGYAPFNKQDPGPHFPWDQLISDVHKILVGLT